MLIIFHILNCFITEQIRNWKNQRSQSINITNQSKDAEVKIIFDPPLYIQRYSKVYYILTDDLWKDNINKLVDFGCSTLQLFKYLKELNLSHLMFVDIDSYLLETNAYKVRPLAADYLLERRTKTLEVTVFEGNVTDPDYRLLGTDVVTAIELIEHLYPHTLDAFPYNIFHYIKPKLVLITTPNSDFNIYFASTGFRHPDHKFEWSREQFEDWSENIITRFPDYGVEFYGIGEHPFKMYANGACSQMAVFIRKDLLCEYYNFVSEKCQCADISNPNINHTKNDKILCKCGCSQCQPDFSIGICSYYAKSSLQFVFCGSNMDIIKTAPIDKTATNDYYHLITHEKYPSHVIDEELKLTNTIKHIIQAVNFIGNKFYIKEKEQCEIPLSYICDELNYSINLEETRNLLVKAGYEIETNVNSETGEYTDCIFTYPIYIDDSYHSSQSDMSDECDLKSEHNENCKILDNVSLSDWDEEYESHFIPFSTNDTCDQEVPEKPISTPIDMTLKKDIRDRKNRKNKEIDFDQLNELAIAKLVNRHRPWINDHPDDDSINGTSSSTSSSSSPHASAKDAPIAGPSSALKKNRIETNKKINVVNIQSPLHDAKSIMNCIVLNSLNIITDDCDYDATQVDLIIEDLLEENLDEWEEQAENQVNKVDELPAHEDHGENLPIVENSDLANNNRDNEGNNLDAIEYENGEIDKGIDLLNYNVDERAIIQQLENNVHENNNEFNHIELEDEIIPIPKNDENDTDDDNDSDCHCLPELDTASREALVDVNSERDSLDDFDIPLQHDHDISEQDNAVVDDQQDCEGLCPAATTSNRFPYWLLQLLNSDIVTFDRPGTVTPLHPLPSLVASEVNNESDFYCQGDGLAIDMIEADYNAANEDETSWASSESDDTDDDDDNDYAEVEPAPSGTSDTITTEELAVIRVAQRHNNASQEDDDTESE